MLGSFSSFFIQTVNATIVAGSVFGPALLRMALTPTLDAWVSRWPYLGMYLYLDDMAIRSTGTHRFILERFFKGVADLDSKLGEIGMNE